MFCLILPYFFFLQRLFICVSKDHLKVLMWPASLMGIPTSVELDRDKRSQAVILRHSRAVSHTALPALSGDGGSGTAPAWILTFLKAAVCHASWHNCACSSVVFCQDYLV